MESYRVYEANDVDEILVGESNDIEEAFEIARERWNSLTAHDQKRTSIRVIKFLHDIDNEDCSCFYYNSYEWYRWYAVRLDEDDYDHGYGSFNWYEAYAMAGEYFPEHPEVRIVTVDCRDDYCIEEELYEDAKEYMETY